MFTADYLLEAIQKAIDCPYLSDLRTDNLLANEQTKARLMEIPLGRYSVSDWNEAASYITGEKCCFASSEEARNRIILGR